MLRRAPWSPTFVGLEPVTMATRDDDRVPDLVTPGSTRVDPPGGMAPLSSERDGRRLGPAAAG